MDDSRVNFGSSGTRRSLLASPTPDAAALDPHTRRTVTAHDETPQLSSRWQARGGQRGRASDASASRTSWTLLLRSTARSG